MATKNIIVLRGNTVQIPLTTPLPEGSIMRIHLRQTTESDGYYVLSVVDNLIVIPENVSAACLGSWVLDVEYTSAANIVTTPQRVNLYFEPDVTRTYGEEESILLSDLERRKFYATEYWVRNPNNTLTQILTSADLAGLTLLANQVAADAAQTALDSIATGLDASQTSLDRIQTGQDAIATNSNANQTSLDRIATGLDAAATAAAALSAEGGAAQTALDRAQTGLDVQATALDSTATSQDALVTSGDVAQTALDRTATAQDRTQTGLDRVATGADRTQTGLDRTATGQDKIATAADRVAAAESALALIPGTGPRLTGVNSGVLGEETIDDNYMYKCTLGGPAGVAIWLRFALLSTVPPTDIFLTNSGVAENKAAGEVVGELSSETLYIGDSFTYTLVAGEGSNDNALFVIDGEFLKTAVALDYEEATTRTIRIRTTDIGELYFEKQFTISIVDLVDVAPNGAPNTLTLTPTENKIDLAWVNGSNNGAVIIIQRSLDGIVFTEIARVADSVAAYSDTSASLAILTNYHYRLRAVRDNLYSAYSNVPVSQLVISVSYQSTLAYGIERDKTVGSSAWTRIGSYDLHRTLPIQSKMKGCLLLDNGVVNYYLNPTDWTKKADGTASDRSGAHGQVKIEIPDHYEKFEEAGNIQRGWFSEYPIAGYYRVKKHYISAYEPALQRSTGKLCSVINMDPDYRGGTNQATWDGTNRTLLGRPVTNMSRTAFRNAARLRYAGTKWNQMGYDQNKVLGWLILLEFANFNSQLPVNAQLDGNGFRQGGLGTGVTDWDGTWNTFNSNNPFIPCGHSDSLANGSGEVPYNVMNVDMVTILKTVKVNRYRGIELPYGHIWKWLDGVNVEILTDANGGTSKLYVANSPADYNDVNYAGHTNRGLLARASGWKKVPIMGQYGELEPSEVGGGDTTYMCDYWYTDATSQGLRGLFVGGAANDGSLAGFGCSDSHSAPSTARTYFGSRLCYIPG